MTEAYELIQYISDSEPFLSETRGAPNLVGVGNPLECSIPVASKTFQTNKVS